MGANCASVPRVVYTALYFLLPLLMLSASAQSPASQARPKAYAQQAADGGARIAVYLPGMRSRTIELDAPTLFHTLAADFFLEDDGTIYVQTGDIPAMWLRDSAAQMLPYLRFLTNYQQLGAVANGIIARDAKNILISSYANAFTSGYKIWEEKWEVDSLAYPVMLISDYWGYAHDRKIFTRRLHWALTHVVETYECEQQHRTCSHYRSRFLSNHGSGPDYADTGMIWSAFRPSDDPVRYPFNIAQQMFAAKALAQLAHLVEVGYGDETLALQARELAAAVLMGIEQYSRVYDFHYGWIYAYEVDGKGGVALMDDANLPNLVGLRVMRLVAPIEPMYTATRRFSLSGANQYYYRGRYAAGLGSSHTPTGWVWPLALITAGLTATTVNEVVEALTQLRAIDGSSGLLYESVDPNIPWHYTRSEFGWANAMYAELIFRSVADLHVLAGPEEYVFGLLPFDFHTPQITSTFEQWRAAATIYGALTRILAD